MMVDAMPFVVGKKAGVPEGNTVAFGLTGPLARRVAIEVADRRARPMRNAPESATVELTMSTETFGRLACGRLDPQAALGDGRVTIVGDADLGRRIVEQMNYMF
jgi:putative sterol carrier protein